MLPGWSLLVAASLFPAPIALGTSVGPSVSLSAAAAASGRPPECLSGSRRALARGPSIWEAARVPNLPRYCDLLARAHTQLPTDPEQARAAAREADQLLPGHPAPRVLLGRAALALGALDEAARAFDEARALDPRSVEDPGTMHDLGRVLARTGKRDQALTIYRALVPRIDLLGSSERRISVLLEAAHVSMAAEGAGTATPPAEIGKKASRPKLDEAVAYLREARQRPPTTLTPDLLLSLALVLDRAGDRDASDAALAEAQRAGAKLRPGGADYLASDGDDLALAALAAEGSDRATAQKQWEAFLAGPGGKGPWAAAAHARLDLLKKGAPPRAAAPAAPGGSKPPSPARPPKGKPR
ncbi:MAG: tetratricopeptide repeat protein [Byssovorax sp.]